MVSFYDSIDWVLDDNGDFARDNDGDIKDTSYDTIQSTLQEIKNICRSQTNDWSEAAAYASNLDEFIGEPNIRETGKRIESRIIDSIVINRICAIEDLQVVVVPIAIDQVAAVIVIEAMNTDSNSLDDTQKAIVSAIFNLSEGDVEFVDPKYINLHPKGEF